MICTKFMQAKMRLSITCFQVLGAGYHPQDIKASSSISKSSSIAGAPMTSIPLAWYFFKRKMSLRIQLWNIQADDNGKWGRRLMSQFAIAKKMHFKSKILTSRVLRLYSWIKRILEVALWATSCHVQLFVKWTDRNVSSNLLDGGVCMPRSFDSI